MDCKNCAFGLESHHKFCNHCGAKVITNRLTLRSLWEEFRDNFLNVDNRIFKTFLHMFTKPEVVIGGYIGGVRKRYFNVVSYYAMALTVAGLQIFILRKFFPEALDISILIPENTPQSTFDMEWTYDYYTILALINIPIYSLMAWLSFIGLKKYNFTEHLVVMGYVFAQFTFTSLPFILAAVALGANFYISSYVLLIPLFVFTSYCYKKLYPLPFWQIAARALLFIGVGIVFLIIVAVIQLIVLIATGGMQEMIEAQRAAQQSTSYIASSVMNWTS